MAYILLKLYEWCQVSDHIFAKDECTFWSYEKEKISKSKRGNNLFNNCEFCYIQQRLQKTLCGMTTHEETFVQIYICLEGSK